MIKNDKDLNFDNIQELVIVIVGYWNVRIFNPAWLKQYLLKDLEVNTPIDFSLDLEKMIISGYKFDGIELLITHDFINIMLVEKDIDHVNKANKILLNILKLLPFTPVKGIGYNVKYTFPSTKELSYIQEYRSVENLVNDKFKLSTYNKKLIDNECDLNLIYDKKENDYSINFNFHYHKNVYDLKEDTFLNKIIKSQNYLYE